MSESVDNGSQDLQPLACVYKTLPGAFQATCRVHPNDVALRVPGGMRSLTWSGYRRRVQRIATGLNALGVRREDTVGIMLVNRPEFHLTDTAALHLGAVPFSIYNTLPAEQIRYVCTNAANRVMITEHRFLEQLYRTGIPFDHIVCIDGPVSGTVSLAQLMRMSKPDFNFEATWRLVEPDDLATISYTSGTTGAPKGVELTHANVLAQLDAMGEHLPTGFDDRIVSYLPAAHIADRITAHYNGMVRGVQVTSLSDAHDLADALIDTRPTIVFGVPQVWQRMHAALETAVANEPHRLRRATAQWAIDIGRRVARRRFSGKWRGPWLRLCHRVATTVVLSPLRHKLGLDEVRFAASGAAPIPADVLEYFHGLGIPVTEVWGLSEASGVSTTTTADSPALGSVGKPIRGVSLKLSADYEILVRGPTVMRGYHGDPAATANALHPGGWLATGDVGAFDDGGNLTIIGRKDDMMINSAGKNLAPANVEIAVRAASFLIGHVMSFGDRRPYVTALITLDMDAITRDAAACGFEAADVAELATRPNIRHLVSTAVREGNRTVSRPEQIKRFVILDTVWSIENGELTPKHTLRRRVIHDRYADTIESLYAPTPDGAVIDLHET